MALIPQPEHTTAKLVYETWEKRGVDEPRLHFGASEVGGKCARAGWYSFRWSLTHRFDGRMLRLFSRGHREEELLADDLRRGGVELHTHDSAGNQYEFKMWGGHFAGHYDGVGRGFPEAPKTWHVWECKTSNQKQFDLLVKAGVRAHYPKHFAQMQIYMGHTGVKRAMYNNVNKNTDEVYVERVEFDQAVFDELIKRAEYIVFSDVPPPRISEKPDWWECKQCDYYSICHEPHLPEVNCRTCAHSTPERSGAWTCSARLPDVSHERQHILPPEVQKTGCKEHRYIPILLNRFAIVKNASDEGNWIAYELRPQYGGGVFANAAAPGLSSQEIRNAQPAILAHPAIEAMKAQFPEAKLV